MTHRVLVALIGAVLGYTFGGVFIAHHLTIQGLVLCMLIAAGVTVLWSSQ